MSFCVSAHFFPPCSHLFFILYLLPLPSAYCSTILQRPGTPFFACFVFLFFLPVSTSLMMSPASCVLLRQIERSIHLVSSVLQWTEKCALFSSSLSPLHFIITEQIRLELGQVTQCRINRRWLRVRIYRAESGGRSCIVSCWICICLCIQIAAT